MELEHLKPHEWLEREFLNRKKKNPAYSMRRFASFLNISAGRLSQYLSGKRPITLKAASKFADKISPDPKLQMQFINSVERRETDESQGDIPHQRALTFEEFELISKPIHYSLLSLMETNDFRSELQWIAKRLGVSKVEVSHSLRRLERLRLIKWSDEVGYILNESPKLSSTKHMVNRSLQLAHVENLQRICSELEEVDMDLRDLSSMTVAIDPKRIPLASEMVKDFRRKLAHFLESGEKSEVYQINIQLFPVTKPTKGAKR